MLLLFVILFIVVNMLNFAVDDQL